MKLITVFATAFAAFIVCGAFFNLYYFACVFVTTFLLGITSEIVGTIEYGVCLIAGFATGIRVMWQFIRDLLPLPKAPPTDTADLSD